MEALDRAINQVGGVGKLAAALCVVQGAVSNWRKRGGVIAPEHCSAIERATQGAVRRWDLRPADWHLIWPELIGAEGAPVPSEPVAQDA